ncbi:hypothetical protein ABTZ58_19280 [Streptomyces sp. NPDC094143]|uniref:hypothetical protein n=1 Tax=Streptomyces sp. NPDC094143 TaxID=3155310 RepID=UPI0033293455
MEKHGRRGDGGGHGRGGAVAPGAAAAEDPRVGLRVLVADNGDSSVGAVVAPLESTGIPYTTVDANDTGRPVITESFPSDTAGGRPRAKYQGVVLPNEAPSGADPACLARARGAMVCCAVPGTGDHPWGTLPYTLENAS